MQGKPDTQNPFGDNSSNSFWMNDSIRSYQMKMNQLSFFNMLFIDATSDTVMLCGIFKHASIFTIYWDTLIIYSSNVFQMSLFVWISLVDQDNCGFISFTACRWQQWSRMQSVEFSIVNYQCMDKISIYKLPDFA